MNDFRGSSTGLVGNAGSSRALARLRAPSGTVRRIRLRAVLRISKRGRATNLVVVRRFLGPNNRRSPFHTVRRPGTRFGSTLADFHTSTA